MHHKKHDESQLIFLIAMSMLGYVFSHPIVLLNISNVATMKNDPF